MCRGLQDLAGCPSRLPHEHPSVEDHDRDADGHLSAFFARIIEWDYPDAPTRPPVFSSDRPIKDKPLPRFLDDPSTAKSMAAARNCPTRSNGWRSRS